MVVQESLKLRTDECTSCAAHIPDEKQLMGNRTSPRVWFEDAVHRVRRACCRVVLWLSREYRVDSTLISQWKAKQRADRKQSVYKPEGSPM